MRNAEHDNRLGSQVLYCSFFVKRFRLGFCVKIYKREAILQSGGSLHVIANKRFAGKKITSHSPNRKVTMLRIILFYVPMGASSLLAALTHVIVNGVLARSQQPDVTISSYAVALSLSFLIDLPMNVIRQTSSKYSRDRVSFRSVARLSAIVAVILVTVSVIIGWTPAGQLLFRSVFGVKEQLLAATVQVYQVLAFLYVLTSLRGLFQGLIINQLRTGWMTVGMMVRVAAMFGMSWYFINKGWTNDGRLGALIFMVGVVIECVVSVWEGWSLKNRLPPERGEHSVRQTRQLLPFYMPLLYSQLVLVVLNPSIQAS